MKEGPSRTAELMAFIRAAELRRPPQDRIIEDPEAPLFLGPLMRGTLATVSAAGRIGAALEQLGWGVVPYILARHRVIEEALLQALRDGQVEQLVVLGAGYDTRPWRLREALGGAPVFEVDHPATHARKAQVMAAHPQHFDNPNVRSLAHDFRRDELRRTLLDAGFDPSLRSFFTWEGVSMYLTRAAVKGTLQELHDLSAPGSRVAADFWFLVDEAEARATAMRMAPSLLHLLGEPITFGIHPEDLGPFLQRLGFDTLRLHSSAQLERDFVTAGRRLIPGVYVVVAEAC